MRPVLSLLTELLSLCLQIDGTVLFVRGEADYLFKDQEDNIKYGCK